MKQREWTLGDLRLEVYYEFEAGHPAEGPTYESGGEPATGPTLEVVDVGLVRDGKAISIYNFLEEVGGLETFAELFWDANSGAIEEEGA